MRDREVRLRPIAAAVLRADQAIRAWFALPTKGFGIALAAGQRVDRMSGHFDG